MAIVVDCLFMVICHIWAWQSFFATFELIVTSKLWKWIKNNEKDIFDLKTHKQSLKDTQDVWELNNKHSVKPQCPQRRNHDGYSS